MVLSFPDSSHCGECSDLGKVVELGGGIVGKNSVVILALGNLAVMQGLKLDQMSLLVAGLIAIAFLFLTLDYQIAVGIVLALASMKPQLVVLLLVWLGIWMLGGARKRYRWAWSFLWGRA